MNSVFLHLSSFVYVIVLSSIWGLHHCNAFTSCQPLHLLHLSRSLDAASTLLEIDSGYTVANNYDGGDTNVASEESIVVDRRPHEQRVSKPRKARRLNHPFQHLYRHSDPSWDDDYWNDTITITENVYDFYKMNFYNNATSVGDIKQPHQYMNSTFAHHPIDAQTSLLAIQYLHIHGGYTLNEILDMHKTFPPLLEIDVIRHLRPKMRFLKDCLYGTTSDQVLNSQLKDVLPANFYGSRLERTVAPRHAFLAHVNLPSGKALWDDTYNPSRSSRHGGNKSSKSSSLLEEFLLNHRQEKKFAAMCNQWRSLYGSSSSNRDKLPITSEQIVAFDKLFQRGILSAARDDSAYIHSDDDTRQSSSKSPTLLQTANATSAQLIKYLIQHGVNPYETDVRGASLFHWAAGCGNLEGLKELVNGCDMLDSRLPYDAGERDSILRPTNPGVHCALLWKASRDDATPFHWAAAGAGPKSFGTFLVGISSCYTCDLTVIRPSFLQALVAIFQCATIFLIYVLNTKLYHSESL